MKLLTLPGDGVGPEVIEAATTVAKFISKKFNLQLQFEEKTIGKTALQVSGKLIPEETLKSSYQADVILAGPIEDSHDLKKRNYENVVERLEKKLGIHTYVKPIKTYPALLPHSYLKENVISNVDFIFIQPRLNIPDTNENSEIKTNYSQSDIEYSIRAAFNYAKRRKNHLTLLDRFKETGDSNLWLKIILEIKKEYPSVQFHHIFADDAIYHIIKDAKQFDVFLVSCTCDDIVSNISSLVAGTKNILAMAKLGHKNIIYQPIHGSESKLKGKNLANPIGAISAVALMFELSFGLHEASKLIDVAINRALNQGYKTIDLAMPNEPFSHTNQVTEAVIKNLSGFHSFIAKATLLNQQDFIYPEGL